VEEDDVKAKESRMRLKERMARLKASRIEPEIIVIGVTETSELELKSRMVGNRVGLMSKERKESFGGKSRVRGSGEGWNLHITRSGEGFNLHITRKGTTGRQHLNQWGDDLREKRVDPKASDVYGTAGATKRVLELVELLKNGGGDPHQARYVLV